MSPLIPAVRTRFVALRWGGLAVLVALLAGSLPALVLVQSPAEPVVIVVNTGSGGLVLLPDRDGRWLVVGGSAARTSASAALDRHLPAWERSLGLLLAPPPHAAHLPGALEILDRRSVGRASLLGLSPRPQAVLERWAAHRPAEPIVAPAEVPLAGGGRLWLDPGDDPSSGGALVLIERGEVRLLLLFGEAAALAETRHATGRLARPMVAGQLTRTATPLPATMRPALVLTLEGANAVGPPRTLLIAPGQALRLTLHPDRLRLEGDAIAGTLALSGTPEAGSLSDVGGEEEQPHDARAMTTSSAAATEVDCHGSA